MKNEQQEVVGDKEYFSVISCLHSTKINFVLR